MRARLVCLFVCWDKPRNSIGRGAHILAYAFEMACSLQHVFCTRFKILVQIQFVFAYSWRDFSSDQLSQRLNEQMKTTNENVRWNASKSEMSSEDFDWNTKICGTVWISTSCGKVQAISAHQLITMKLWRRFSPKRFDTFKQKTTGAWSALKTISHTIFPFSVCQL